MGTTRRGAESPAVPSGTAGWCVSGPGFWRRRAGRPPASGSIAAPAAGGYGAQAPVATAGTGAAAGKYPGLEEFVLSIYERARSVEEATALLSSVGALGFIEESNVDINELIRRSETTRRLRQERINAELARTAYLISGRFGLS